MPSDDRRTYQFARDIKLSESDAQAAASAVRVGDLSTVLRVYEDELATPVRSALTGNLTRSLLIQVRPEALSRLTRQLSKAKSDVAQALSVRWPAILC